MPLSRWIRSTASAAIMSLLLPAVAAHGQCDTTERWQRVELNVGSGVAAPLIENRGHLPPEVAYAGLSAAGTAVRFQDASPMLVMVGDNFHVALSPVGADAPPTFAPTDVLEGEVSILGAGLSQDSGESFVAFGGLEIGGLWGAATAETQVTGRTWRATWSGPSSDLERLAFQIEGLNETVTEPSGELRLFTDNGPVRGVTLFPAKASVGDEVVHIPFVASADGVVSLGAPVPEGASLETLLVFASYTHDYDAVADGAGGFAAVGTAIDTVSGADGTASGRDIAILRLDETGRGFLGMTVLASSGEDDFAGITAVDGDVWVAGTAGANDFAFGSDVDSLSPFVARLDARGTLVAGRHLGELGVASVDDLALDGTGRLVVAGRLAGDGAALPAEAAPLDVTVILPVDTLSADVAPDAASAHYAVMALDAGLDAALDGELQVQVVEAASTPLPLETRPGCDGGLEVGAVISAQAAGPGECLPRWNRHEYPQAFPSPSLFGFSYWDNYANVVGPYPNLASWGFHALRWKELFGNYQGWTNPPVYDAVAAAASTSPSVPTGIVVAGDHQRLNALEATSAVFSSGDPGGSWLENDAFDYLELSLGASAYLEFWGSPTYANLRYDTGMGNVHLTNAVAITDIAWCSNPGAGVGAGPLALCQQQACQNPPCKFPIDTWDDVCTADPAYAIQSGSTVANIHLSTLTYTHWENIFTDRTEVYWQDVRTRFDQASPNQIYVSDPPTDAEFARSFVDEGVQRELARVVESVPVQVTTFVNGKATSNQTTDGLVRAVDRLSMD